MAPIFLAVSTDPITPFITIVGTHLVNPANLQRVPAKTQDPSSNSHGSIKKMMYLQ